MLQTGKYSVKQVGLNIGFSNLSNFAKAFKKEFGILPKEILKGRKNNLTKSAPNNIPVDICCSGKLKILLNSLYSYQKAPYRQPLTIICVNFALFLRLK